MYEWDDILIVGDSWCSERHGLDHWPNLLLKKLTEISIGIPRGQGFPGCSWWSTRNKLFDELKIKPAKVIIIIHTESTRIPSDDNSPMTVNMAFRTIAVNEKWNTQKTKLKAKAAAEYYSYLYSANFHMWAERKWFEELDNFLISHENAKIIHLYGHRTTIDNSYEFRMGVTVKPHLFYYFERNTENIKYPNHMDIINNHKLALCLKDMILNYPGHGYVHRERLFENDEKDY